MDRFRIDWERLGPLPRKKPDRGATTDDLAARRHNMQKAKHKGRCHISNQKRRQIAKEQAGIAKDKADKKLEKVMAYKAAVRAFWLGKSDEHPKLR